MKRKESNAINVTVQPGMEGTNRVYVIQVMFPDGEAMLADEMARAGLINPLEQTIKDSVQEKVEQYCERPGELLAELKKLREENKRLRGMVNRKPEAPQPVKKPAGGGQVQPPTPDLKRGDTSSPATQ